MASSVLNANAGNLAFSSEHCYCFKLRQNINVCVNCDTTFLTSRLLLECAGCSLYFAKTKVSSA